LENLSLIRRLTSATSRFSKGKKKKEHSSNNKNNSLIKTEPSAHPEPCTSRKRSKRPRSDPCNADFVQHTYKATLTNNASPSMTPANIPPPLSIKSSAFASCSALCEIPEDCETSSEDLKGHLRVKQQKGSPRLPSECKPSPLSAPSHEHEHEEDEELSTLSSSAFLNDAPHHLRCPAPDPTAMRLGESVLRTSQPGIQFPGIETPNPSFIEVNAFLCTTQVIPTRRLTGSGTTATTSANDTTNPPQTTQQQQPQDKTSLLLQLPSRSSVFKRTDSNTSLSSADSMDTSSDASDMESASLVMNLDIPLLDFNRLPSGSPAFFEQATASGRFLIPSFTPPTTPSTALPLAPDSSRSVGLKVSPRSAFRRRLIAS